MTRILFVCLGNICRSPMAEFLFRDMVEKRGLGDRFDIASRATSGEEAGNPIYPGTRKILSSLGISCAGKHSVQLVPSDYSYYDWIFGMDSGNLAAMGRIFGGDPMGKVRRLLDLTDRPRDIADPWYTGNFEDTHADVIEGLEALMRFSG